MMSPARVKSPSLTMRKTKDEPVAADRPERRLVAALNARLEQTGSNASRARRDENWTVRSAPSPGARHASSNSGTRQSCSTYRRCASARCTARVLRRTTPPCSSEAIARCVTVATGMPRMPRTSFSRATVAGEATTYPAASSRESSVENVPRVSTSAAGASVDKVGWGAMR